MSKQISRVVENSLKFLKLTKAGKLYLSAFPSKVLYRAKDMFIRERNKNTDTPFSSFVAMCVYKDGARDVEEKIDTSFWDFVDKMYPGNNCPDMTFDGEKKRDDIISTELNRIRKEQKARFNSRQLSEKTYSYSSNKGSTSFNRGIMYFKYGQWYKLPDKSWNRDARPSLPISSSQAKWLIDNGINPKDVLRKAIQDNILAEEQINKFHLYDSPMMKEFLKEQSGERPKTNPIPQQSKPKIDVDDPRRYNLVPVEQLKKAIAKGNLSKKGLSFLRDTYFSHKPELIKIIDEFLNDPDAPCSENQSSQNDNVNQTYICPNTV